MSRLCPMMYSTYTGLFPCASSTGMDLLVPNYPHDVKRLLNPNRKALFYEFADVFIQVLARQTQLDTNLLNRKSQKSCAATGRATEYCARLFVINSDAFWSVGVRRRCAHYPGMN